MNQNQISRPIYSIIGTTASGKTQLVLDLAEKVVEAGKYVGVDIISADAKQVYQGLEILTGADIPKTWQTTKSANFPFRFFQNKRTRLHAASMIKPTEEWSVSLFVNLARTIIAYAEKNQRLVLIVGGAGLYHQLLLHKDQAIQVSPNYQLREELSRLELSELQERAQAMVKDKFFQLNRSDRHNPRRLVRLIEQKMAGKMSSSDLKLRETFNLHHYFGLKVSEAKIKNSIHGRVKERFNSGAIEEVTALSKVKPSPTAQTVIGFRELSKFIAGEMTEQACRDEWFRREWAYAKRQITWWKHKSFVTWFDPADPATLEKLFAIVNA